MSTQPLVLISGPPDGPQYAAAEELAHRLPGASVLRLERPAETEIATLLSTGPGPVLAPMAPQDAPSFRGLVVPVLALGHDVRHVLLVQSLDDVRQRLSSRDGPPARRAVRAQEGRPGPRLSPCVETAGLTVAELADRVATSVGLALPD